MLNNTLTRVSPGMYRNSTGGIVKQTNAIPRANPVTPATPAVRKPVASTPLVVTNSPATQGAQPATTPMSTWDTSRRNAQMAWQRETDPVKKAQLRKQLDSIRSSKPAPTPTTPAAPTTDTTQTTTPPVDNTPAPVVETPEQIAAKKAQQDALMGMLFPSKDAYNPDAYTTSPIYKYRENMFNKGLQRKLATNGLTNSGAELEAYIQGMNQVGAEEAQRIQNMQQTEADRLERLQTNEVQRQERVGNSQWDRLYNMMSLLYGQDPTGQGLQAAGGLSDLTSAQGKLAQSVLADQYARVMAGGGGGGGGGMPSFVPPAPSGPDYSTINQAKVFMNGANNTGYSNTLNSFLSSLFG